MLFKALILGSVLLASAPTDKQLRSLEADVDRLLRTLKTGDLGRRRKRRGGGGGGEDMHVATERREEDELESVAQRPTANHMCDIANNGCGECRRGSYPAVGIPPLSFVETGTAIEMEPDLDDYCGCKDTDENSTPLYAVKSVNPVPTCQLSVIVGVADSWTDAISQGADNGFKAESKDLTWHGCSRDPYVSSEPVETDDGPEGQTGTMHTRSGSTPYRIITTTVTTTHTAQGNTLAHVC
jgi:hypothetical protein